MGQYQLWLQYRAADQNLRREHITYTQELSEIDEHIARLEKMAMPTNNGLLTLLMQQLKRQDQTTSQITEATGAQPEQNKALQESANSQNYQTPLPSNYGQQNTPIFVASPAWEHLPHLAAQDIYRPEEMQLADTIPASPEAIDHLLPTVPNARLDQKMQEDVLPPLPWWLRNLTPTTDELQEPQQMAPTDQQSTYTNQRVEHWFVRRTRLVHYEE